MLTKLDDLALCAYALCEDPVHIVNEYADCIPEALYVLHSVASSLGLKIRFSTVSALIEHVVEINRLREDEISQIVDAVRDMAQGRSVTKASRTILRILLRRDLNLNLNEQEIAEVAIAALYSSMTKTVNSVDEPGYISEYTSLPTPTTTTT